MSLCEATALPLSDRTVAYRACRHSAPSCDNSDCRILAWDECHIAQVQSGISSKRTNPTREPINGCGRSAPRRVNIGPRFFGGGLSFARSSAAGGSLGRPSGRDSPEDLREICQFIQCITALPRCDHFLDIIFDSTLSFSLFLICSHRPARRERHAIHRIRP